MVECFKQNKEMNTFMIMAIRLCRLWCNALNRPGHEITVQRRQDAHSEPTVLLSSPVGPLTLQFDKATWPFLKFDRK